MWDLLCVDWAPINFTLIRLASYRLSWLSHCLVLMAVCYDVGRTDLHLLKWINYARSFGQISRCESQILINQIFCVGNRRKYFHRCRESHKTPCSENVLHHLGKYLHHLFFLFFDCWIVHIYQKSTELFVDIHYFECVVFSGVVVFFLAKVNIRSGSLQTTTPSEAEKSLDYESLEIALIMW